MLIFLQLFACFVLSSVFFRNINETFFRLQYVIKNSRSLVAAGNPMQGKRFMSVGAKEDQS